MNQATALIVQTAKARGVKQNPSHPELRPILNMGVNLEKYLERLAQKGKGSDARGDEAYADADFARIDRVVGAIRVAALSVALPPEAASLKRNLISEVNQLQTYVADLPDVARRNVAWRASGFMDSAARVASGIRHLVEDYV